MTKKKILIIALILILMVLVDVFVFAKNQPNPETGMITLSMDMKANSAMMTEVYYSDSTEMSVNSMAAAEYKRRGEDATLKYAVPIGAGYLRIDLGERSANVEIKDITLWIRKEPHKLDLGLLAEPVKTNNIASINLSDDVLYVTCEDDDPFIIFSVGQMDLKQDFLRVYNKRFLVYNILISIAVGLLTVFVILHINSALVVPKDVLIDKGMLWDLAKNDFKSRFAGSYFGVIWAFIQPIVMMILYWFVFQVGLRAGNVVNYPFILYLMCGMIPWFYFSEVFGGGTNCLMEYSYLVKKVVFKVSILPMIKVISALFVHLFFVAFLTGMCMAYGFMPSVYTLQIFYYIFCTVCLVIGLVYATSAVAVFFKDMTQIVNIILTVGVWVTPIMWNAQATLSGALLLIFKVNPMYYIVDGFRDALLARVWFWDKAAWTVYFWIFTIAMYAIGTGFFNRSKAHFADVL